MKRSVVLDIHTACTVVENDKVMSFHWNSQSTAAPVLLLCSSKFGLKKRWCAFQSIISLAPPWDVIFSSLYHFHKDKEIHCVIKIEFWIIFVLFLLATYNNFDLQETLLPNSKMVLTRHSRVAQNLYSSVYRTFLSFHARCQDLKQWVWQPWRWPMVRLLWEETDQALSQR